MSFEVVFEKRFSNANVHRDVDVEQRRQCFLLTSLAAVFVVALLFYGWQQYRWIDLGYKIEAAQQIKARLVEDQKRLELERASLAREERIDSIARNQLGMVVAAPGQIVTAKSGWPSPPSSADIAATPLSAAKR